MKITKKQKKQGKTKGKQRNTQKTINKCSNTQFFNFFSGRAGGSETS